MVALHCEAGRVHNNLLAASLITTAVEGGKVDEESVLSLVTSAIGVDGEEEEEAGGEPR